jgi:phage terminase large subunit-like protein
MFDNEKALHAVNFIELLKHTKGSFRGKPFKLLPWQHEIITDVYGTLNDKGLRQYQFVYLEVPKKNGKSELVAATALYHTFADGEIKGEIYGCAADRAQASLAFDVAVDMVDQNPYLKKRCKYTASKKQLLDKISGSIYQVLSAEAYTKHGLNASAVIFDELHAQPNRDLWEVMTFGAGDAREQPIWWVITTAGDDPDRHSIGWEIHEKAQKIINGELVEPRWYCKIWGIPPDYEGDIWDEELWYETNPSLGYTIDIDKVRLAAASAKENESEEKLFRWLRLNQWVSLKRVGWLPLTLWDSTIGKWSPAELVGKKCYIGLDLSSTGDLTGACALFPPQDGFDEWRSIYEAWIPEESMKERIKRDHAPYDRFVREKHLIATPGNAVDYDFVEARLLVMNELYDVQALCPDPWNSRMLTQRLDKAGMTIIEVSQTMAGQSPAMKELERLMKTGQYTHENHPVARWCFGNVQVAVDGNGNIKPMKNKSIEKIDLTVAEINAMAIAMLKENEASVYERRGMRSLL